MVSTKKTLLLDLDLRYLWAGFAFFFGTCFGSFANVIAHRYPIKETIVTKPSYCPACQSRIRPWDLIPVLSWFILLGKCRQCKARISFRYPFVELVAGLLFAKMAFFAGSISALPLVFFVFVLLAVTLVDIDVQEIPDGLVIAGTVVGVIWVGTSFFYTLPFAPLWHDALIGAVVGAMPLLIFDRLCIWIVGKDGFGYGDVKLMAMVGIFIGWQLVLLTFFIAFVSAGAFALILVITKRIQRGAYIAFGPFLCGGTLVALWFSDLFLQFI